MAFFQILEVETNRDVDELRGIEREWRAATEGERATVSTIVCRDRDRPNTYLILVEFPNYEQAMRNSSLPATQKFAEQLREMTTADARFFNLDELYREQG